MPRLRVCAKNHDSALAEYGRKVFDLPNAHTLGGDDDILEL
jgi:hypothetical protein